MSKGNFTKWHIAGLHALRSANEQGSEAGKKLEGQVADPEVKALLAEYETITAEHQKQYVGFLKELDAEPNDFTDRIMKGVAEGTDEMVKAAPDQQLMDLSAISGSVSGLDYYVGAFKDQSELAAQLGYAEQSATMKSMGEEAQDLRDRFSKAADTIRANATTEA